MSGPDAGGRFAGAVGAELTAVAGLLAMAVVWFLPVLWPGWGMSFDTLAAGDVNGFVYPSRVFTAVSLAHGQLPLWNPWYVGGFPVFADLNSGTFYPPGWLLALLSREGPFTYYAYEIYAIAHVAAISLGAYLLARDMGCRPAAAVLAGLALGYCGYMGPYQPKVSELAVLAWAVPSLICARRARLGGSLRWAALSGTAMALSFLAGYFELFAYLFYFVSLYYLAWAAWRREMHGLVCLAVFGAVTVGLAAVQWLPVLQLKGLAVGQVSGDRFYDWPYAHVDPSMLFTLFTPSHFEWNGSLYMGLPVLVLCLAAPLSLSGGRAAGRGFDAWFLALAGAGFAWLSLGTSGGLYAWARAWAPGVSFGRFPIHGWFVTSVCMSLLAGLSLDGLLRRGAGPEAGSPWLGRGLAVLAVAVAAGFAVALASAYGLYADKGRGSEAWYMALRLVLVLACLAVLWRGWSRSGRARSAACLLVLLLAVDLHGGHGVSRMCFPDPASAHYPRTAAVEFLRERALTARVYAVNFGPDFAEGAGIVYGFSMANGYWVRLVPRDMVLFHGPALAQGGLDVAYWKRFELPPGRRLDLMNVGWIRRQP